MILFNETENNIFDAFKSMAKLELINFNNVSLTHVPTNAFSVAKGAKKSKLKIIDMSFNQVRTIADNAFYDLNNLEYIGFRSNTIDYISEYAFHFPTKSSKLLKIDLANSGVHATKW